jgi:hypothetical protein
VQPAQFTIPTGGAVFPVSVTATASGNTELSLRVLSPSGTQQLTA